MSSPLVNEGQCSHMFFSEVMRLYGVLPLRVHGTAIEVAEGVDAVYFMDSLRDLQKRKSKLLLVQEKASITPPYSFLITKVQHDKMCRRQKLFKSRAYFYGFFCVKDFYELFQIFVRTIFVEAVKIPQFSAATRSIRGSLPSFSVVDHYSRRTGYPFAEIFRRFINCYIGIGNRYFPILSEDLYYLLEEKIPFHLLAYDIERNVVRIMSPERSAGDFTDRDHSL